MKTLKLHLHFHFCMFLWGYRPESPRTKSPPDRIPSKYSSRQNPLGHKPLGTKSPRDRIPLQKNCFKKHIWTKNPRTNPTQDKIPYRQYPL